ncbi:hemerythrin domain-containing protein [Streptomyces sp. NPDC093516]|uniref:hemerythrin domain-containing protein n=1 Tax=Streptomyces sp. NPDC093516 TaxID=3155304 RepID=UPI003425B929
MSVSPSVAGEGTRLFEELRAAHTVLTRAAGLVASAFVGLADGAAVDTRTLMTTTRWLVDCVRSYHGSGQEMLWPVLRERFPLALHQMDRMTEDDDTLREHLDELAGVASRMADERTVCASAE